MRINSILAPTDFSETAVHAVEQAMELALRTRATLHIHHVHELHGAGAGGAGSTVQEYLRGLEDDGGRSAELKLDALRKSDVDVFYESSESVSAFDGIAAKTERLKPDLVVIGTHGRTGVGRLLLGSVAEKAIRHLPVDVMTVSKSAPIVTAPHLFERVVVAVDFSEFSKRALAAASELAVPDGELFVVHVVASPVYPGFYAPGAALLLQADPGLAKRIHAHMNEWLGEQTVTETLVREGDVLTELSDVTGKTDAQLVIMGTRGLSGLDHLLVGSVTEKMVRTSKVPVLAVH